MASFVEAPSGSFTRAMIIYMSCGVTEQQEEVTEHLMGNMGQGGQDWVEPALLSVCPFTKDHPLRCQGMKSIPEEQCLLALLTYVILKETIITQRPRSGDSHLPFSEMR